VDPVACGRPDKGAGHPSRAGVRLSRNAEEERRLALAHSAGEETVAWYRPSEASGARGPAPARGYLHGSVAIRRLSRGARWPAMASAALQFTMTTETCPIASPSTVAVREGPRGSPRILTDPILVHFRECQPWRISILRRSCRRPSGRRPGGEPTPADEISAADRTQSFLCSWFLGVRCVHRPARWDRRV
jgi:hypothetical protein